MKPTIVLAHGAYAESSNWNAVIERLQAAGHRAIAAAVPCAPWPATRTPWPTSCARSRVPWSSKYRDLFLGSGVSAADALVHAAEQRPVTESALNEPATAAAWQTIPSWVVIGTKDRAIPPEGQRFMARRAGARVTEIPAAHVSMLTFPGKIAAVIEAAAR